MSDDVSLMLRASRGDRKAFRSLVERHQQSVYNFFLRTTGHPEDAEDLTQQLFINLYRSAGRYKPTASFRTFMYRIASNLAVSFARSRHRRDGVSLDQMLDEGREPPRHRLHDDPAAGAEWSELEEAYLAALAELPADWRTAVELRVGRQLSYKEIAQVMGKSVSAVESILFRARERLAEKLEPFKE
ncbi:MAG: sigma-70 family RNA polymerase sigma factor [bacterium]|nr:MAG: sigma-70 family RNA polymerase sigma factor [bacterium]